jgi:preprotein translocase subunit SecE
VARSRAKKNTGSQLSWLRDNAVTRYLRETRAEVKKVHWPTRDEAESLTKVVMIVTISMSILMGLLDYLFALELRGLIAGNAVAIGIVAVFTLAGVVAVIILNRQRA